LSTNEGQSSKFLETLKSNYKQRIKEADNFSRNFSNSSADFRSQYLAGLSDMLQYYLDLQKKLTKGYPLWYDADRLSRQSRLITEAWINTTRNMFSSYSSFLDFGTKNMRNFNQGIVQLMQIAEMFYDMSENVPPIQRNVLVDLIKQTKEYNDNFVQKQLPKKRASSYKEAQKKQVVAK